MMSAIIAIGSSVCCVCISYNFYFKVESSSFLYHATQTVGKSFNTPPVSLNDDLILKAYGTFACTTLSSLWFACRAPPAKFCFLSVRLPISDWCLRRVHFDGLQKYSSPLLKQKLYYTFYYFSKTVADGILDIFILTFQQDKVCPNLQIFPIMIH